MPNGNAVANFSLATDESYNDRQTGQKVEQTEFHRITVYGKLAEIVQQYLKKGSRAYFEGKLRTRQWEKDGIKRYSTEIIANDILMLDGRNENGQQVANAGQQAPAQQPAQQSSHPGGHSQPVAQNFQQAPAQGGYQQPPQQAGYQPGVPANTGQLPPQNGFNDFDDDIPF